MICLVWFGVKLIDIIIVVDYFCGEFVVVVLFVELINNGEEIVVSELV